MAFSYKMLRVVAPTRNKQKRRIRQQLKLLYYPSKPINIRWLQICYKQLLICAVFLMYITLIL